MMSFLKVRKHLISIIKNFCTYCKFMVTFFKKNFVSLFLILSSLCVFFYIFSDEFLKFMVGNFESTQAFFQKLNGFDSSRNFTGEDLTEQEKHIRKVNAKLDHQIKQAEEARQFAQEREKNPELPKFFKDHAFAVNVFVFVFCWMVIFNTIAHMPPSSPPPPSK